MSSALSPLAMLATSMQAQPGVYALLLGSGVSTSAGVPTGWGVVTELVRRVAAVEDPDSIEDAASDPEKWWHEHHSGTLGYSSLLEALAPTSAARQGLLADFFEPSDEDREQGIKTPSKGHLAIAELVKRGSVKVVITTNFDRLMEQALDAVGVAPQVIARPEAVKGMKPLTHSAATVIKIHGDYLDLGTRNTPSELDQYPKEWKTLLARVFDEYGLVVSGWSAEWDTALVKLMEATPNRRYPLYWDRRSGKGSTAQRLLAARFGQIVPAAGADEMFSELLSAVEALDRLAEPPLTTAMAMTRLKRYLPDPVRRIDLHDLVMDATDKVAEGVRDQPLYIDGFDWAAFQEALEGHRERARQLCVLLVTGVWHDSEGDHDRLWMDVLERLIQAGAALRTGRIQQELDQGRLYPALLVHAAMGVAATRRGRDALLIKLSTEVMGTIMAGTMIRLPACQIIHPHRVLDDNGVNALPRWNGGRWRYPASHLLKADVRALLKDLIPGDDYEDVFHGYEYRMSLLHARTNAAYPGAYSAGSGEYVGEHSWSWDDRDVPLAEIAFREAGQRAPEWPWASFFGDEAAYDQALIGHRAVLEGFKYHRMG